MSEGELMSLAGSFLGGWVAFACGLYVGHIWTLRRLANKVEVQRLELDYPGCGGHIIMTNKPPPGFKAETPTVH